MCICPYWYWYCVKLLESLPVHPHRGGSGRCRRPRKGTMKLKGHAKSIDIFAPCWCLNCRWFLELQSFAPFKGLFSKGWNLCCLVELTRLRIAFLVATSFLGDYRPTLEGTTLRAELVEGNESAGSPSNSCLIKTRDLCTVECPLRP